MAKVDIILNGFRRTRWLSEQIEAVKAQTVSASNIFLWKNKSEQDIPEEAKSQCIVADCRHNLGVWSRFGYALNSVSDYVCVLDDDTIPGPLWLENCLKTMETNPGLMGTVGVLFGDKHYSWQKLRRVGWCEPNQ